MHPMNLEYYDYDLKRAQQKRKRSPIVSCSPKERPRCRKAIIKANLVPYPHPEAWDGCWAFDDNGENVMLSDGMRAQMRKMIVEGYWM